LKINMADFKTPLYSTHLSLNATMIPFAGYNLPSFYSSINHEHNVVRSHAGIFDVSHMGQFIVRGNGAIPFLQKLLVNDVESLKEGQAHYSAMCYKNGGIIDDLIVYKKKDEFMLVVNASNREKDFNWLSKYIGGNVYINDVSDSTGLIAIQGPMSKKILQVLTDSNLSSIEYYHFINGKISGVDALISRTGYTGELGYELYINSEFLVTTWEKIIDAGQDHGIEPAGLGCRDTLRMEMKYLLYGMDIDEETNPIEAGLGWITKLNKANFIGRDALRLAKKDLKRRLVCIIMAERAIPRKGCQIYCDNNLIGTITSGTMSPSLGKGIGIGYVNSKYTNAKQNITVDIRGKVKKGMIIKPPFYKKGSLMD